MSTHSARPVEDSEVISRFVFSPVHVTKKGELKPSLFSQVATNGCSVQRDDVATNDELLNFIRSFLLGKDNRVWIGVVSGICGAVRAISVPAGRNLRAICVYDTAESHNPAHSEMFQTGHVNQADEADALEVRRKLLEAFGNGAIGDRRAYKQGVIWNGLSPELQARTPK